MNKEQYQPASPTCCYGVEYQRVAVIGESNMNVMLLTIKTGGSVEVGPSGHAGLVMLVSLAKLTFRFYGCLLACQRYSLR